MSENINSEVWRDVVGYSGLYMVSNIGRIKSLDKIVERGGYTRKNNRTGERIFSEGDKKVVHGRVMITYLDRVGYVYVSLSINKKSKKHKVHRLVAMAFVNNVENKKYVNHKNGDKTDNIFSNLEWVSSGENQKHAYKTGLKKSLLGALNSKSKKVIQYDLFGNTIKKWDGLRQIERDTGFLREAISRHCRGSKMYSHAYGFLWKFEEDVFKNENV